MKQIDDEQINRLIEGLKEIDEFEFLVLSLEFIKLALRLTTILSRHIGTF